MKLLGWLLVAAGLVYGVLGTWAIYHWRGEILAWAGMSDLAALDASPVPLRFAWALAVLIPAAAMVQVGALRLKRPSNAIAS